MNENLKELYYQDDVIIGSKQNFINLAKQKLKASTKEINEFLSSQEINQVNKKPTKHTNLRITAPPRTYQLDIMYYPVGTSSKNILDPLERYKKFNQEKFKVFAELIRPKQ